MRGVDHQLVRLATLGRQRRENAVEDAEAAPADEPVVDCLVRAVVLRSIAPAWPLRITKIMPLMTRRSSTRGTPCDCGKCCSILRICASDNQIRSLMATPPDATIESTDCRHRKQFNRS
jgi:hypothetical protein